ncbi:asparagine synthase (glutamine-hydrolyzing) [Magnetococcus marinus MC-1]|uniref:asparagine synthase (glutamine-hydrolyzing) n=1 Tax=Magnetococcus marinus (strain ATCC BAA-1437 / JCM 17883 / MC-1) TaxID=156889 RepID=A0LCM5_MAGMM|nr:asparagine synthase (glutamine-hydrolyzing) [Magnetococcus marinus]ABK45718.1 asparagine synthase (glutamine-hydrolyzing) [Magnetococcus marinus MC-1]
MCGISGFYQPAASEQELAHNITRMTATLQRRGPDDGGFWLEPSCGLALGHRRLAIQDLSPLGHQPMADASGRYQIVFNGEIYNFLELKQNLERHYGPQPWRGHSDTEVLLALIGHSGLEAALAQCRGMFALALWDRQQRILTLARDRLGEKPLYYGRQGDSLLFASELKALRAHPHWQGGVDRHALTLFMRHSTVPAPYTIHPGIHKLQAGCYQRFQWHPEQGMQDLGMIHYWSMSQVVAHANAHPFDGDETAALQAVEQQLMAIIGRQMVADVPLGAFLSGGIDSSLITAMMQAQSSRPVQSFTIGFAEASHDESAYAQAIARHLGTQHTTLQVTPQDALALVPSLPLIYDEPFSDASQLPTTLLAGLTRQHVTVALSGDGGDELFGGYDRYGESMALWRLRGRVPSPLRRPLARAGRALPSGVWSALLRPVAACLPAKARDNPGDIVHKMMDLLVQPDFAHLYRHMLSHWSDPGNLVVGGHEPPTNLTRGWTQPWRQDPVAQMMYWDTLLYLPDDILVKVDRAAMWSSLECRIPLLDHRLVELVWSMPMHFKRRDGVPKWLLQRLLGKRVPEALFERPKMGFGVPLERWLRGPLKGWAQDLLAPALLQRQGYLNPEPIARIWRQHQQGSHNWHHLLWDLLMWQAWLAEHEG